MKYNLLLLLSLTYIFIQAQTDTDRLIEALLSDTPIENDLMQLCDEIGGRITGSKPNQASIEWGYKKFKDAGVSVKKQSFTMPVLWLPGSTSININIEGTTFAVESVAKYRTDPTNLSTNLIPLGIGSEALFVKNAAAIKDQFILIETDICFDIDGLFAEYTQAANVEILAEKYGAKGILYMASRPNKLLYRFITSKTSDIHIPQYVVAREDAKRIFRLGESKDIKVHIESKAKIGDAFESQNVIAEIKGSTKPDEIILIGAHLDSWALGTGANDNGCNVSMMIDIARQMIALGIKPKRTIRFALWNGEEQGYFGSWAYTKRHEDQLKNHKMALSVDIGSGSITGFFLNGREVLDTIVKQTLNAVDSLGPFHHLNVPIVGTDNFDFMLQGVPNLVANHKPDLYGYNYHAASDTYDKVNIPALKKNSAIIAALTLGFANGSDEMISPLTQQTRPEIQQIFDDSNLEFTMRMFNVWEPWINKKRGAK